MVRGGLFTTFATVAAVGCRYRGTSIESPPSTPEPIDRSAAALAAAGAPPLEDSVRFGGEDAFAGDPPDDLTGDGDTETRVGVGERVVCLAVVAGSTSPRRSAAVAADGVAPHGGRTVAFDPPRPLPLPCTDTPRPPPLAVGLPPPGTRGASAAIVVAPTPPLCPVPSLSGDVRARWPRKDAWIRVAACGAQIWIIPMQRAAGQTSKRKTTTCVDSSTTGQETQLGLAAASIPIQVCDCIWTYLSL